MSDLTVTDQPPEGEPENITPEVPVCLAASRHGGICGQPMPCDGSRHNVTPEAECPNGAGCEDHPRGHHRPRRPERRTVSLEVLTDELRAVADVTRMDRLPAAARVAVVLRVNGEVVGTADTDVPWLRPDRRRSAAIVLAFLLQSAGTFAEDGNPHAELLMPTPDVLAALAGTPDATFWTEPIELRVERVKVGWIAVDFTAAGSEDVITAVDGGCADSTCPWHGDCTAITAGGEPIHFADWQGITVRIPAGPVTR